VVGSAPMSSTLKMAWTRRDEPAEVSLVASSMVDSTSCRPGMYHTIPDRPSVPKQTLGKA
jgi:hypothetical protein